MRMISARIARSLFPALGLCVFGPAPASADPVIFPHALFSTGGGVSGSALADMNGDGRPDLVIALAALDQIAILFSNADGTLAPPVQYPVGDQPSDVALGDIDGDLDIDVVVTNLGDGDATIYRNDGAGVLTNRLDVALTINVFATPEPRAVALGDIDGDGDLDLVVVRSDTDDIAYRKNNGAGTFNSVQTLSVENEPSDVALGDLNGDGDMDIVVTNEASNTVTVRLTNGAGGFLLSGTNYLAANQPRALKLADVNGDTILDLIVVTYAGTGSVAVRLGTGTGSFGASTATPAAGHSVALAVEDLDNDGDRDIVVANEDYGTISIFPNNSDGTLAMRTDFDGSFSPSSILAHDFDNDGDRDIAVTSAAADKVVVASNTGAGAVSQPIQIILYVEPDAPVLADIDGDADLDILVPSSSDHRVMVVRNLGAGEFDPVIDEIPTAGGPTRIRLADIDADGDNDLVVLLVDLDSFEIWLNDGAGAFSAATPIPAAGVYHFRLVDVNGDTRPDLISWYGIEVSVRFNNGSGGFGPAMQIPIGMSGGAEDVALADIDNDGDCDLAAIFSSGPLTFVYIAFNDGSGTFGPSIEYQSIGNGVAGGLRLLDMDSDGDADLVWDDFILQIRVNDGAGNLGPKVDGITFGRLTAFADVDLDGALDLISRTGAGNVVVSKGLFPGVFAIGNTHATGEFHELLGFIAPEFGDDSIGDLDGNGSPDIVVATDATSSISILLNELAAPPPNICVGDITGEGSTNSADFNILASNFGASVTPNTNGDLTGDGIVNSADFNVLAGDFGCVP